MTIVKVQRPLDDDELPWLVGEQEGEHRFLFHPCDDFRRQFGADLKRYYNAELIDGYWSLRERVEDQPW